MEIKEFYRSNHQDYWLSRIEKSDWDAGKYLYELLKKNRLKELCGETTKVFLLTDKQQLVSFCTLAESDDVPDSGLAPWIGFVYTFPEYRGHRYIGVLLEHACRAAKNSGAGQAYISTGETGLYEKYGYSFYQMMKDINGENARIYRKEIN